MSNQIFRQATTQVERGLINSRMAGYLFSELLGVSLLVLAFTKSWAWGGATLLGLVVAFGIPKLRMVLVFILSAGWSGIGFVIGLALDKAVAGGVVCAIIAFIVALAAHLMALEWLRDYSSE